MYDDIMNILPVEIFRRLTSGEVIQIAEINAVIALLLKTNIPYDMSFSPSNRRFAKQVRLTIFITPTTTLSFSLQFEGGSIAL